MERGLRQRRGVLYGKSSNDTHRRSDRQTAACPPHSKNASLWGGVFDCPDLRNGRHRQDTIVYHLYRKPFANSFPSDMMPLCITSTGNHCVSSPQEKAPAFAGAFSCEIVYTKRRALWLTVIPGRPWILATGRPFLSWLPQLLFRGLSGVLRISDRCRRSFRGFSRSFLFSVLPGYLLQRGDSWI